MFQGTKMSLSALRQQHYIRIWPTSMEAADNFQQKTSYALLSFTGIKKQVFN